MSGSNQESPYTREWLERNLGQPARHQVVHDGEQRWLLGFHDHEVARAVNEVRRIALNYGGSHQLRDRLSAYLAPILKGERRP